MISILRLPSVFSYLALAASVAGVAAILVDPAEATASPYIVTQLTPLAATELPPAPSPTDKTTGEVVISQKGRSFEPTSVTVRLHRRITIKNDDDTVHHAFCSSADFKYNSGPQEVGSTHNITFRNLGTFEIRCAIHPQMRLVVTVVN